MSEIDIFYLTQLKPTNLTRSCTQQMDVFPLYNRKQHHHIRTINTLPGSQDV